MAKGDCYNFVEKYLYILIIFAIFYTGFLIYNNLHIFLIYFFSFKKSAKTSADYIREYTVSPPEDEHSSARNM